MALPLLKLAGALATGGLVVDVAYTPSGTDDLFDLLPGQWADVVRITAMALAALGVVVTTLEVLCPRTATRLTTRPAGSLVAASTSAI